MSDSETNPERNTAIIAHSHNMIADEIEKGIQAVKPDWTIRKPNGMANILQTIEEVGKQTACVISEGSITIIPKTPEGGRVLAREISDGKAVVRAAIAKGIPHNLIFTSIIEGAQYNIYTDRNTGLSTIHDPYLTNLGVDTILRRSLNENHGVGDNFNIARDEIEEKIRIWLEHKLKKNES